MAENSYIPSPQTEEIDNCRCELLSKYLGYRSDGNGRQFERQKEKIPVLAADRSFVCRVEDFWEVFVFFER